MVNTHAMYSSPPSGPCGGVWVGVVNDSLAYWPWYRTLSVWAGSLAISQSASRNTGSMLSSRCLGTGRLGDGCGSLGVRGPGVSGAGSMLFSASVTYGFWSTNAPAVDHR